MQRSISLALLTVGALLVYEGGLLAYGIYALVLGAWLRSELILKGRAR